MAYARKTTRKTSTKRRPAKASSRRAAPRRTPVRRSSPRRSEQVVRIVLEQPSQRPSDAVQELMAPSKPKRNRF
jgi:hypothetical protein